MDYKQVLQNFKKYYTDLEQASQPGSMEKHVYGQILQFFDRSDATPNSQQGAFEAQISLNSLGSVIDPPEGRQLVRTALDKLTLEAQLPPVH